MLIQGGIYALPNCQLCSNYADTFPQIKEHNSPAQLTETVNGNMSFIYYHYCT